MGQKVNPISLRLGITKTWQSNWYAEKKYASILMEDIKVTEYIRENLKHAGIASVEIERAAKSIKVHINAARPGIIIGRKGEEAEKVKTAIAKIVQQKDLVLNIKDVRRPETDAQLVADNIAFQLVRRMAFRRVMKKTLQNVMRFNVTGCKIMISGRLNGAEMARTEWVLDGQVPLHTLKADINYAVAEAKTIYGILGVKVWIYKTPQTEAAQGRRRRRKPTNREK
ncbi:MAG: 30S ribosomal protein S3 [SAR324 cluster bacterium]|uniref:Small ribosomal subunit protein uS3 n=1 Tax=SAR324 cluster bacterium TaxID=2024889 RepID=A0A2A4TBN3_9DELT|nr:MAG: 30S ribosomal protein S3 [SAR324 cluster bacterium]